jgi:hypothetical protein
MGLFDGAFDPMTMSGGVLPGWLGATVSGLQNGPSMLQAFPPSQLSAIYPPAMPASAPALAAAPLAPGPALTPPAPREAAPASPMITPGLELPPAAAPTTAAAPTGLSSFLPSLAPSQGSPGVGDRLMAALMGFTHGGAPIPAIGNLIGGLITGQRQDPRGVALQMMQQQQGAAYEALRARGVSDADARAAVRDPHMMTAIARQDAQARDARQNAQARDEMRRRFLGIPSAPAGAPTGGGAQSMPQNDPLGIR